MMMDARSRLAQVADTGRLLDVYLTAPNGIGTADEAIARLAADLREVLHAAPQPVGEDADLVRRLENAAHYRGDDDWSDRAEAAHRITALLAENERMAEALRLAVRHIEHMAAWIGKQKAGYSFESLGEDMPGIKAALPPQPQTDEE